MLFDPALRDLLGLTERSTHGEQLTESKANLGPEYLALVEFLRNMDLTSKDGQEIVSTFDKLDESCPH